jgi:hypothetical protein
VLGRVSIAGASIGEIAPGATALVRVRLETPAVPTREIDSSSGRIHRHDDGGGIVLDPRRPAGNQIRSGRASLDALRMRADGGAAIQWLIDNAGLAGIATASLVSRMGVPPSHLDTVLKALAASGTVVVHDRWSPQNICRRRRPCCSIS